MLENKLDKKFLINILDVFILMILGISIFRISTIETLPRSTDFWRKLFVLIVYETTLITAFIIIMY